ncbi:MAG: glycosyltransferase family 2 protein [Flavipsychrobacter sp.]|nr:glycosyltransferase family 2 protein [Flavipsychrobacter sp.]
MKKNLLKLKNPNTNTFEALVKFASFVLTRPGYELLKKLIIKSLRKINISYEGKNALSTTSEYNDWITKKLSKETLALEYEQTVHLIKNTPKISIIVPVYNPPIHFLKEAINSVIDQSYTNWELCLADDKSPNDAVRETIKAFSSKDERIKFIFRTENGHISAASNSAWKLATGDFILLMDHDDLLTPNCLFEFVKHVNLHPEDDFIYSDEDKIDDEGERSHPHFKPDWAPDNLLSRNYIGHVTMMKKSLMDQIAGFRIGFEGSQDYDIFLRATEQATHIGHIPKVLYHWRIHSASVALNMDAKPYAFIAAKKALEEALVRRNTPGTVDFLPRVPGGYRITYEVKKHDKVSIIIPTKDQEKLLEIAIQSIFAKTSYTNYEIIIVNNNSTSPAFFELIKKYTNSHGDIFRCIDANFPFNFSKLMNVGVAESTGEYILFLNNDVEVIHEDWMTQMVGHAQRKETGIVGVKLLYPDDTIQHAGVIIGILGAAAHIFVNAKREDLGYYSYIQSLNNYAALTAACILFKKNIYLEVGGMDENLEVDYNDIDLCLKVYEAGYYNVYVPTVELYHYESATRGHPFSSKENYAQHKKNYNYFIEKWGKIIVHDPFYNPNLGLNDADFRLRDLEK